MTPYAIESVLEDLRMQLLAAGQPDSVIEVALAWARKLTAEQTPTEEQLAAANKAATDQLRQTLETKMDAMLEGLRRELLAEAESLDWPDSVVAEAHEHTMERATMMMTEQIEATMRTWNKMLACRGIDSQSVH